MDGPDNPFDILVEQRSNFIILGLTGRTGSGCTTASTLLRNEQDKFPLIEDLKHDNGFQLSPLSQKRYNIAKTYADKHFPRFFVIKISDLISSIILTTSKCFFTIN
ncbi:hypothetical protein [Vibrio sp.]|uniref:hypothetical protein n=1 Tax=Vibrio sp. TaxID=678 RepID=UPI0031202678